MSRFYLLTVVCVLLCVPSVLAQEQTVHVLTLDEVFRLAEENSKQLNLSRSGMETARRATDVVRNARLPSIDASLSFSYIGDGTMLDRDFGHSMRAEMPHWAITLRSMPRRWCLPEGPYPLPAHRALPEPV